MFKPTREVEEVLARLRPLPPADADRVLIGGDENDVTHGLRGNQRSDALALARESIVVPAELTEAHARAAFTSNAIEAAVCVVRGEAKPTFAEMFPELAHQHDRRSQQAAFKLPQAHADCAAAETAQAEYEERRRTNGEAATNPAPLRTELARTVVAEIGLAIVEGGALAPGICRMLGLSDQPVLQVGDVLMALGAILSAVFATALFARWGGDLLYKAEKLGKGIVDSAKLLKVGLGLFFVIALLLLLANGAVRMGALTGDDSPATAQVGIAGLGVLSLLAATAAFIALVALRINERRQRDDLVEVQRAWDAERQEEGAILQAVEEAETERDLLQHEIDRIETVRTAFSSAVTGAVGALREVLADTDRVNRAIAVYRYFSALSPTLKRAVIRHFAELGNRDGGGFGGRRFGGLLSVAAFLTASALVTSCAAKATPQTEIAVCDPTSKDKTACTPEAALGLFEDWEVHARAIPGSRFILIVSDGTYSRTTVVDVAQVPLRYPGKDPRAAYREWFAEAERKVLSAPYDDPDKCRNRSDDIDAILIAYQEARAYPDHDIVLAFLSDGLNVDANFNFERKVPTLEAVTKVLRKSGLSLELPENIRRARACGLGLAGNDAASAIAVKKFWMSALSSPAIRPDLPAPNCNVFASSTHVHSSAGVGRGSR